ncbi:hypothetical protein B1A_16666 [mine drainage metagenome]|uniref:Uncharacterized protein n=1 Tax=mine drainage metagenome TaxID=410659 RepID=T0ZTL3_9ZZZZ
MPARAAQQERSPLRRFHGSVRLDPTRLGRDAGRVAEEVIAHLVALHGAEATITLEVQVSGFTKVDEHIVRTVTENIRALKFEPGSGFEAE